MDHKRPRHLSWVTGPTKKDSYQLFFNYPQSTKESTAMQFFVPERVFKFSILEAKRLNEIEKERQKS